MNLQIFKVKLLWILIPIIICILSISISIFDTSSFQNNKIFKFWNLILESENKLSVIKNLIGFSRNGEYNYKKFPILRPKFNIRERNNASTWNDLGIVLQSKWPKVPLEASLIEFLSEFYNGIGKTFEDLMRDLIHLNQHTNDKKILTTKFASELVGDNLGIKLMETMVINRYYSPRIESIRTLERSQREMFGIICKKASWIIVVYQGKTIDTFCDSNDLYNSLVKGRSKGFERADKYDLSFSKFDVGKEHILESSFAKFEENSDLQSKIEIFAYIDFSDNNFKEFFQNIWNIWDLLKNQENVKIKIRHCDQISLSQGFEYLSGFGVSVSKLSQESNLTTNSNITRNSDFQYQYQLFQAGNIHLEKSHKDEEYEILSSICDKAVNMEKVLNSDGELSIECMKDIGAFLVSLSKRFEDQLGSMIHFLENFGTYQLALCNGIRDNTTLSGYSQLQERISEGSTFFTLNGRLFSPTETNFFNLITIIKSLIFSKIRLLRNQINDQIVITDSLSITGINEKEELNLFMEIVNGNFNSTKITDQLNNVIKDQSLKSIIEKGEILHFSSIAEFENDLELDPTLMDDLDWLGRKEYVLSSSSPWLRNSPRTDWKISNILPLKSRHFYKDITNIGDSQWGETPNIFEKVWFNRNVTNEIQELNNSNESKIAQDIEYSPWIMYRIYFSNQVRNSRFVLDYTIYDIMKEPENTLGQYLYPLESLPELFEKYPENVGLYPVRAAILEIIMLCDPLDIECISVTIEMINKKWPIKLNILLIDPEWVNTRKPDYTRSFSYRNITSDEDFQTKFREINQEISQTYCERYYGKDNIQNCPDWMIKKGTINTKNGIIDYYQKFDNNSKGEYVIKFAISQVFGFLVSSSTIQGMFLARAFLEMIAKNLPLLLQEDFTLSQFQEFLNKFFTHFSINAELTKVWEIIYSNNPNDSSYVNKVVSYCRLKGFTTPGALVNGYFVEITDLVLEEVIFGIAKKEQRMVMEGVKNGQITSSDDIYQYLFNNTLTGINSVPIVFPPFTKSIKFENWPFIGIQNEWKQIEKEINLKLNEKYDTVNINNKNKSDSLFSNSQKEEVSDNQIMILEDNYERILLDFKDLSSLDYSILWDMNPELKQSMENIEKKRTSTPWITFIALVKSSRTGLLSLSTLIDYWISTISYQASLHLNQYNELLFNRRFRLMFIPQNVKVEKVSDISLILERCISDVLDSKKAQSGEQSQVKFVPILDKLRFIKWFIKVIIENMDEQFDHNHSSQVGLSGEKVLEIYESLSIAFFGKNGNGRFDKEYLEDIELVESQNKVRKKLVNKFSSRIDNEVISFPYSSVGNGKLKGFPKYANYNLNKEKSDQTYGKGSFQETELSNKDCFETFSMGIVINGVYLRICPNTYPVYIRNDVKVNYWSSPIHTVHLKLLETAITNRMRQLVLIGEFKRTGKKEDLLYRRRWSNLDPNRFFMLISEHLHISNLFKSESLIQMDDIFSSSSSLIKLHLPSVKTNQTISNLQDNHLIGLVAVINPMTAFTTYTLRLFDILHQLFEADIKIVYNPVTNYQSMEEIILIDTWRRYVFNYPKLQEDSKDSSMQVLISLKDLMYSKGSPSEFKVGNDHLYNLNSQLIAKFDIQTEKNLQVNIERMNDWSISYLKTVLSDLRMENSNFIVPSNISKPKGELMVYELKGREFEATLLDIMSKENGNLRDKVREFLLIYSSNHLKYEKDFQKSITPVQKFYSITDFNSFFGYLGVGNHKLLLGFDGNLSNINDNNKSNTNTQKEKTITNLSLKVFNQRLFESSQFVIHLSSLSKSAKKNMVNFKESSKKSKGLLKVLHILCLSTQMIKKDYQGDVIDKLIDLIDKGFSGNGGYYNKFVIYFDSRDVSQSIREYYNYKLFWKYYINIEYLEITRPKWIPRLSNKSNYNNNSLMDVLLTLEHWISPNIKNLLILDPFLLDVSSDLEDYFEILDKNKNNVKVGNKSKDENEIRIGDSALLFLKKGKEIETINTRMGLILINRYKLITNDLRRSYFEMYYDIEVVKKLKIKDNNQSLLYLFITYLIKNQLSLP